MEQEELLYIDQHIFKVSKTRRKKVAMAWTDYRKAYVMVTLTWITDCLKRYTISDKVIKFIMEAMKNWKVELTAGGENLTECEIHMGIF